MRPLSRSSGVSAVVVLLSLTALGAFLALGINSGHLFMARNELQNAADSAVTAALREIDGSMAGIDRARAKAVDFASRHVTDTQSVALVPQSGDVRFGIWNGGWNEVTPQAGNVGTINAVRVLAGRQASRGNPLEVFFSSFLGRSQTDVVAQATATQGAPCDGGCLAPLYLASCTLQVGSSVACDSTLVLSNDSSDTMGLSDLVVGGGGVGTSSIINALQGSCRGLAVGQTIGMTNGNNLNMNVVNAFTSFLARNGNLVRVPVFQTSCPAKFNGSATVIGFATLEITSVSSSPRKITAKLSCHQVDTKSTTSGCANFGTASTVPTMVQ